MADRDPNPFLFGVYGIEATEEMLRFLKESNAAGIYLLRRNIETTDQVREFVRDIEEHLGYRILVAIDHEGGRVFRFTRGVTFFPGNLALGRAGSNPFAHETGKAMARELSAMGINVNFAPVVDVATDQYNPDLCLRSFGMSPTLVGGLGVEMIRGLQEGGVSATARHFPGRGSAVPKAGSAPVVTKPGEQILEHDLVPFQAAIAAGVHLIMSAHVAYTDVDAQPATFSKRLITDLLREEMGYKGIVVTEDLTSPGVLSSMSGEEAAVQAFLAGHDLLVLAHDVDLFRKAVRSFKVAVDGGRIPADRLRQSQDRIKSLLATKKPARATTFAAEDADEAGGAALLAGSVAHAAVKVERDPQHLLPLQPNRRIGALVPRLWDVADRVTIDEELRGAAALVQGWMQKHSRTVDVLEIPIQPDRDMMDLTMEWVSGLEVAVFFCFDAHRFAGQRALLEQLQGKCKRTVVVLLANPWDRLFVNADASVVDTFGFRVCQLLAAVETLFKGATLK